MSWFSRVVQSVMLAVLLIACSACVGTERECTSQDDCRHGHFCEHPPDDSCGVAGRGEEGQCQAIPRFCTGEYEPVCGCDGQTYPNACAAKAAAVSLAREGACEAPSDPDSGPAASGDGALPDATVSPDASDGTQVGDANDGADAHDAQLGAVLCGAPGDPACMAGWFCNSERGAGGQGCATPNARGVCQPLPTQCSESNGPVCGCDGRIYEHACDAHVRGMSVREEGGCEERVCGYPIIPGSDDVGYCAEDERCHRPEPVGIYNGCHVVSPPGVCRVIPKICPETFEPVCGCYGGATFRNACQAHSQGHDISAEGTCEDPRPACGRSLPCSEGTLCECRFQAFCAEGEANWCLDRSFVGPFSPESSLGKCIEAPDPCPDEASIVCGCDHKDYPSACEAVRAGVHIVANGSCAQRQCDEGSDCDQGQFCDLSHEASACGSGICQTSPVSCSDENAPVCTCSGASYLNECWAHRFAESVARSGACDPNSILPCAGPLDIPCPDGHVCARECGASPSSTGQCQPVETCPETRDLACGCDGVTYQNACFAWQRGTMLAGPEPCRVCTSLGDPNCTSTEICNPVTGYCEPRQEQCADLGEPVCGCDLQTYPSVCDALHSGMSIRSLGACPAFGRPCSVDDATPCTEQEFCNAGDHSYTEACGPFDGVCESKPTSCPPPQGPPVCVSNGTRRISTCEAHLGGYATAPLGVCGFPFGRCGPIDGWGYVECAEDEFCGPNDPYCGNDIFSQLVCFKVPPSCDGDQGPPVCTCGGVYPNACEAARAHVTTAARTLYVDENGLLRCGPLPFQ